MKKIIIIMRLKPLFTLLLLIVSCFSSYAQMSWVNFSEFIFENHKPNWSVLKDSVASYGFCLKVDVEKLGDKYVIQHAAVNDSIAYTLGFSLDSVMKFDVDFSPLMKSDKKATLIFPYFFVDVYSEKKAGHHFDLNSISLQWAYRKAYHFDLLNITKEMYSYIYTLPNYYFIDGREYY